MNATDKMAGYPIYKIKVKGMLDGRWSEWFNEMKVEIESEDPPITMLSGPVNDQARLRGIINKLWDLNLTVISITSVVEMGHPASTDV
jgi:hypothetical protein